MSRLLSRIAGIFSSRTKVGVDKAGNRYFVRKEEVDGIMKEKRWVVFKGEEDPTSIPVEWICWLNGQRKVAPTPEEMIELEVRRERVRSNVAQAINRSKKKAQCLKKEEEERKAKEGSTRKVVKTGKVEGPDLKSFIRQFPTASEGDKMEEGSDAIDDMRDSKETNTSEPTGSGASYKPGTWQPPT